MKNRIKVINPSRPCAEVKCAPPWAILLYSIIMKAARRVAMEVKLRAAWMWVPWRFWGAVCVGWRRRIACVVRRRPAELRSWCWELLV